MNKSFHQKKNKISLSAFIRLSYLVLLICFVPYQLFSQLKLNSKAPKIGISNWVNRNNTPVKIVNKFIVLDFWATWCAPCLGALPHMNQLQKKFEDHKDLVFLSLTDEHPRKIKEILPRFHFESSIISDTTGNTQKRYGIESIPTVVLIDNTGYIKWVGDPKNLTGDIIDTFLKGDINIDLNQGQNKEQSAKDNQLDSLFKIYRGVFDDMQITDYISITKPDSHYSGKLVKKINEKAYNVCQIGVKISALFSDLLYCNERQLKLPERLKDKTISYCFKSSNVAGKKEGDGLLLRKILQELNLNLVISEELTDVIVLDVSDSLKLKKVKTIADQNLVNGAVSSSEDLKVVSIYNSTLNVLESELNKVLDQQIEIKNLKKIPGYYTLTLSNRSFEDLQQSLHVYGFGTKVEKKIIKKYQFDFK